MKYKNNLVNFYPYQTPKLAMLLCFFILGCTDTAYNDKIETVIETGIVENKCSFGMQRHKENNFWVYDLDPKLNSFVKCEYKAANLVK